MVFVASCKEARYLEEVLRRLQAAPAWIGAIHGRLQQTKRMAKYYEFRKLKHGILVCTDVAARGLDFPAVDWVVQMDAPDGVDSYIHRVGRTARLGGAGSALLFVMPSESALVNKLAQKGIVLDVVEPKAHRLEDPTPQIEALLAQNVELRYLAQKAFVCYMRSVNLAGDKEAGFDITQLPYREYSQSLGLVTVPKIKFGKSQRSEKNASFGVQNAQQKEKNSAPVPRIEKLLHRQSQRKSLAEPLAGEEDAEDFLVLQRSDHGLAEAKEQGEEGRVKRAREEKGDEEEEEQVGEEKKLTAKERRNQRRLGEKKARKEKMREKRGEESRETPKSVAEREALALEMLAKTTDF
jgi:ATP-dependent RNA helicase DDX10/DBP4